MALVFAVVLSISPPAQAAFGIEDGSFKVTALNADGSTDLQAGSHPYAFDVGFAFNKDAGGEAEGEVRDVLVSLPPGFIGNPLALPRCSQEDFEFLESLCPGETQVGILRPNLPTGEATQPVANLIPPPGSPARLGTTSIGLTALEDASLRPGVAGYGVALGVHNIPSGQIRSISQSTWGVPADPRHDAERRCVSGTRITEGCSSYAPLRPFLTLPTSCGAPLETTLEADSKEAPGVFDQATALSRDAGGNPVGLTGCDKLPFAPTIVVQPETTASDSPTGLSVDLHVPQNEEPEGLATANLKDAVVTLPTGMVVNPSSADGLAACSEAQIELEGPEPARCPDASKLGGVEVDTALIDHPLDGSVYLAQPHQNPFHSLIALYIAIEDPTTGIVVKIPGRVEPDQQTGQLKATFKENPQVPFEDLKLDFFGGPRAPLTTPATCGHYTTETDLTPWSAPEGKDALLAGSFNISSGPGGSPCSKTPAEEPHHPDFQAGTEIPLAGAYSTFVLKLSRENGSQRITGLDTTLPPGLLGKLAGIAECSPAQIAQAEARDHEGEGALEQASPSCPASSEVGTITVGAGSGAPLYAHGHAYLAGPYKGAPLSIVTITPAVAGPFDLGVVVDRVATYVDPLTAQIHAVTDTIPTILDGIPLDVRSIAVSLDRNRFTLNPTSCQPRAIDASALSSLGAVAPLAAPFQVGACQGLGFAPKLKLGLEGSTRHAGHPGLKAVLTYPKAGTYANVARAQVNLPHSEFIDQGNLNKTCTRPVLLEGDCPASSVYGHARAWTPLLEAPLEGDVYLVGGFGYKLPALVAELNGRIRVLLVGKVDSGKNKGIRTTFEAVPDAPVEKFELRMKGGPKYSLLENSEDICARPQRAIARFTAQNGKVDSFRPTIATACRKKGRAKNGGKGKDRGAGQPGKVADALLGLGFPGGAW